MKSKIFEGILAALVLILSVWAFVESTAYSKASAFMPLAVLGLAVLLAGSWLAEVALRGNAAEGAQDEGSETAAYLARFLTLTVLVLLYVSSIRWLGFFTATLCVIPAFAYASGFRDLKTACFASVAFTSVLFGIFNLFLKVPLPAELATRLIGAE
ncbi:tripartite tricarboxylate transporter TctB family protein [Roseibium sp.]|uniref:tripartite tricarboxylate transporter TctB family protein n=1 Tax=Roseibium sp. TaxID=1936156 RepID=UPI003D0E0D31